MPGHGRKGQRKMSPVGRFLQEGTYQRAAISRSSGDVTVGTEYEVSDVADTIVAGTVDKMFPWVRGELHMYGSSSSAAWYFEWMIAKHQTTDALVDMDDNAAIERLKRDGKLFARGTIFQPPAGNVRPKPIQWEFRNVKLRAGEELRLWFRPRIAMTAVVGWGLLEWSEVVA